MLEKVEYPALIKYQSFPLKLEKDELTLLSAEPSEQASLFFKELYGVQQIKFLEASHKEIFELIEKNYKNELIHNSLYDLLAFQPDFSASYVFSNGQVLALGLAIFGSLVWLYFDALSYVIFILFTMQIIYLAAISFRMILSLVGSQKEFLEWVPKEAVEEVDEKSLPVYTILVPAFREERVVQKLLDSLLKLDYPHEKLDVIILLEEEDSKTIQSAKEAYLPENWHVVLVPKSLPQTKPKACNYGLQFARGEYVTIYDAEDIPNPDQLKKAVIAHRKIHYQCLCMQAALNYYNADENLITGLFTLEYSYWFDYLLPGLDYFRFPIPLGGTSNHFRTDHLRDLGGWDPYNTTEDADLGLRGFAVGYRIGVINSTTMEEANNRYWNWIRQRSRWIKGYMQTALVYNRHPILMLRQLGWKNWLAFQLLITGTPLMLLINPFIWLLFVSWVFGMDQIIFPELPMLLIYLGFFNLIISNFIGIYLNMLGVFRRGLISLVPIALLNPFYWLFFHTPAAYKALWQLFVNPFYWEKTEHGLTRIRNPEA